MLRFWAMITVVVIVGMALMANYANSPQSSRHGATADKLIPLENSSRELSTAIAFLLSRQQQFLSSESIAAIEQYKQRAVLEQAFEQNWSRLAAVLSDEKDTETIVKSLFSYYQDYLTLDDELYSLKTEALVLTTRLTQHRDDVDLQLDNLKQQLNTLEQRLKQAELVSKIAQLQGIRIALYELEAHSTETFLLQTREQLDSFLSQTLTPAARRLSESINQLAGPISGMPGLSKPLSQIEKDSQVLQALIVEDNGLYTFHQQRLLNQVLLQQTESQALAVISVLTKKVAQLAEELNQHSYQTATQNLQQRDQTATQIVVVSGLIILGMFLLAWLLSRKITQVLTQLRLAMHALAEGNVATRIEHDQSQSEESILASDFNQFAENTAQLINELAQAKQTLESREQHIRTILNGVPEAILTLSSEGQIQQVNPAAEKVLAATQQQLVGENVLRFFRHNEAIQRFDDVILKSATDMEFEGLRYDETAFPMLLSLSRISTQGEEVWVCVLTDVTSSKTTEKRLQQATIELNAILDNAMVGIAFLRDRHFVRVNQKFGELFGYQREEIEGQSTQCLYQNLNAYEQFGEEAFTQLASGGNYEAQLELLRSDGQTFWCAMSGKAVDTQHPRDGSIWLFEDITKQRENEEHLTRLASIDVLTGLPNRAAFTDRVEHAIHKSSRNAGRLAVFFVDLDHFKHINDSLGHKAGDILLIEVAHRIKSCLREGDTVARLGGDEFTLLLEDIRSAEDVGKVAEKVIQVMTKPYQIESTEVNASPSIGISLYPADGRDVDMLIRNADAAMYHAKKMGRNNFQFYSAEMNAKAAKRLAMETTLRRAVEEQRFQLHYQPQVDIHTGQLVGAEALLRWHSEQWGDVSPAEFVPMLEDTGLIMQVGEWVLRQACTTYLEWAQRLPEHFKMAVNLSGRQFKGGQLTGFIRRLLHETGMPATNLELEITESMLMDDTALATITLAELSDMAISLAIDDFGTGYSSLSYLKQFPLNVLKIDSSFVRDVTDDQDDAAIVDAIMAMSQSLGLKVVAEGVETKEQLDYLQSHQCHFAQGYLFSKAVDKADFISLIERKTLI